jgi:uncharacterized RDD family membrane protein YckC
MSSAINEEEPMAANNPFAPPTAEVAEVHADGDTAPAGRGARLGAAIIDGLLAGLIFGLIAWLTPFNVFRPTGGLVYTTFRNSLFGLVVFALLQSYTLADNGQTLGKRLLGIRIARPDGSKPTLGRLLGLRYGVGFVLGMLPMLGGLYGLIDSLLIFRESRRCLHDTIVVRA